MRHPHLEVIRAGMRTDEAKACIDIADEVYDASDPIMVNAARGWITTAAALDKAKDDGDIADALDKARKKGAVSKKLDEAKRVAAGNVLPIRGGT